MTSRLIEPYLHLSVFQIPHHRSNGCVGGHTTADLSRFQTSARFQGLQEISLVTVIFKIHWRSCFAELKTKRVPDYSYLNHWLGRSECSTPLIHFDCLHTTPVVKRDPLQSESEFLCQVFKMGPVIWSQRPRPSWVIGGGWANLGNENVVKVSLQSLPVYNCGSVIYRSQGKKKN